MSISIFLNKSQCLFQDPHSKDLIGLGNVDNGIYIFDKEVVCETTQDIKLWYARMGYMSYNKLKMIADSSCNNISFANTYKFNKDVISLCAICPLAKQ